MVLNAFLAFSQNWNPFVEDQLSYYKQLNFDQSYTIKNIIMDSVVATNAETKWYFDSKSMLLGKCRKQLSETYLYDSDYYRSIEFDSLIKRNDSVLFIHGYESEPDTFLFKPWAKVNESWTTHNGTSIECISKGVQDVFGQTDSIKTFSVKNSYVGNKEFILSKNHGFIKFVPFVVYFGNYTPIASEDYELAGYEKADRKKGYTKPGFKDYFNLNVGDVVYKQIYNDPYTTDIDYWGLKGYYIDSITYAYHSNDSVYYNYQRTFLDKDKRFESIDNVIDWYTKSKWDIYINSNVYNLFSTGKGITDNDITHFNSLTLEIEGNDTIHTATYNYQGLYIDTINCMIDQIPDAGWSTYLSTEVGYANDVIGYKINGVESGEIILSDNNPELITEKVSVYPNPTSDMLKINVPNGQSFSVEVLTTNGELLVEKKDTDNIDLSNFSSGLFIVIIKQGNQQKQFKINRL